MLVIKIRIQIRALDSPLHVGLNALVFTRHKQSMRHTDLMHLCPSGEVGDPAGDKIGVGIGKADVASAIVHSILRRAG